MATPTNPSNGYRPSRSAAPVDPSSAKAAIAKFNSTLQPVGTPTIIKKASTVFSSNASEIAEKTQQVVNERGRSSSVAGDASKDMAPTSNSSAAALVPSTNSREKIKKVTSQIALTDKLAQLVQTFEAFSSLQTNEELSTHAKKQAVNGLIKQLETYSKEAFKDEKRRESFGVNCHDFEHKIPGGISISKSHEALRDFLDQSVVLDFTKKQATSKDGRNRLIMQGLFKLSESPLLNALKVRKAYQEIISQLESLIGQYQSGLSMDDKIDVEKHQTTEEIAAIINQLIQECYDSINENEQGLELELKLCYDGVIKTLTMLIDEAVNPTIEGLYRAEKELIIFSNSESSQIVRDGKLEKVGPISKDAVIAKVITNFPTSDKQDSSVLKFLLGPNIRAGVQAEILRPITTGSLTIYKINGSNKSKKIFPMEEECIVKRRMSSTKVQETLCKEFFALIDTLVHKISFLDKKNPDLLKNIISGISLHKIDLKKFMHELGFKTQFGLIDEQILFVIKIFKAELELDSAMKALRGKLSIEADSNLEKFLKILFKSKQKEFVEEKRPSNIDEKFQIALDEYFRKGITANKDLDCEPLISHLIFDKKVVTSTFSPDSFQKGIQQIFDSNFNFEDIVKKCQLENDKTGLKEILCNINYFFKENRLRDSKIQDVVAQFEAMCDMLHLMAADSSNLYQNVSIKLVNLLKFVRQGMARAHDDDLKFLWTKVIPEEKDLPLISSVKSDRKGKPTTKFEYHFTDAEVEMKASGLWYFPTLAEKHLRAGKKLLSEILGKKLSTITNAFFIKLRYSITSKIIDLHDPKSWEENFSVDIYLKKQFPKKELYRLEMLEIILCSLDVPYRIKQSSK